MATKDVTTAPKFRKIEGLSNDGNAVAVLGPTAYVVTYGSGQLVTVNIFGPPKWKQIPRESSSKNIIRWKAYGWFKQR